MPANRCAAVCWHGTQRRGEERSPADAGHRSCRRPPPFRRRHDRLLATRSTAAPTASAPATFPPRPPHGGTPGSCTRLPWVVRCRSVPPHAPRSRVQPERTGEPPCEPASFGSSFCIQICTHMAGRPGYACTPAGSPVAPRRGPAKGPAMLGGGRAAVGEPGTGVPGCCLPHHGALCHLSLPRRNSRWAIAFVRDTC
jgi:hypothetical protein